MWIIKLQNDRTKIENHHNDIYILLHTYDRIGRNISSHTCSKTDSKSANLVTLHTENKL